jgi:hypothetical protein
MRVLWTVGLLLLAAVTSAMAAEDRCKDILANGVWEYRLNDTDTHNVSAFLNWYGASASGQSGSSKRQSLTGSAIYEGAPVSLGLSNDQQTNEKFLSTVESLGTGYAQYDSRVIDFVKTASAVITKAWADCMASDVGGVHASIVYTGEAREFVVNLRYKAINNSVNAARVGLSPPSSVKCSQTSVSVKVAGEVVRCTRSSEQAGAVLLSSDTVVYPEKTLRVAGVKFDRSGSPYATCTVVQELKNGQDSYINAEPLVSGNDMGGGTPSTSLVLEVPQGYRLSNVQPHCVKLNGDNPCAFVRNWEITWAVPGRKAEAHPTTDSDRVTVSLTGTKETIVIGTAPQANPVPLRLAYGRNFSVEFPRLAVDVKMYCDAQGDQRIFSLSDIERKGDQIYVKGQRESPTGRIVDMAVRTYAVTN